MIQEEFARLIFMYQQAAEGKGKSVEELFKKTLDFIEHLKEILLTGDEEDRQAAQRMLTELHQYMKEHTQAMSKESGLSEEELMTSSENAENFTPEQWKSLQESKERLAGAAKGLSQAFHNKEEPSVKEKPPSPESLMSKSPEKKDPKGKKPKKSHWMRS
jgi:outer membrane biosynthesis protein TonB